jgi:hypothetical protein
MERAFYHYELYFRDHHAALYISPECGMNISILSSIWAPRAWNTQRGLLAQLAQHSMWPTSRPAGGPSGVGRVMGKPLRHRPSVCTGILVEPCPDLAEPTAQPSGRDANSNPDRKAPFRLGDRSTETALARRDLPRKSGQIPLLGTRAKPSTVLLLKRVRGMYKYSISLSLLMSTPVLATEPAYIGVWASDSEGCKYPREVLQITKKEITGNEWMCRIKNISSDGAGWLASLACAGEGSEYTLTSNGHFRETLKTSKPPAVVQGTSGALDRVRALPTISLAVRRVSKS